jgi:chromosome partitioning protein
MAMGISSGEDDPMTYILAIANQKGGVAKTTTVVSLGGALAKMGNEVLLVDLDAQANLTLSLGNNPNGAHGSIADVLLNSADIYSVSRQSGIEGIDLVPANQEMELAERFLPIRHNYECILRDSLNGRQAYDFILLDCPPSMGAVTLNALNAAKMLIIPTQPEYFSAHALRSMMAATRKVRGQHNPGLVYRVLITMQDRRNRIHCELSDQIFNTFGEGVFQTVIQLDTKLRESAVAGLPITHYRTTTRSTLQYSALAEELIQYVQETYRQPDPEFI